MKIKMMKMFIVDMILDESSRDYKNTTKVRLLFSIGFIQNVNGYLFREALVICEPGNWRKVIPRETCIV